MDDDLFEGLEGWNKLDRSEFEQLISPEAMARIEADVNEKLDGLAAAAGMVRLEAVLGKFMPSWLAEFISRKLWPRWALPPVDIVGMVYVTVDEDSENEEGSVATDSILVRTRE